MKSENEITYMLLSDTQQTNKLCRICLSDITERSVSLFEINNSISFSQKAMLCARVEIHDDDGLPSVICEECSKELDVADSFRVKCEYSDSLLRKIYLNGFIKTDLKEETEHKEDEPKPEITNVNSWVDLIGGKIKEELPETILEENTTDNITTELRIRKEKKKKLSKISKTTKSVESFVLLQAKTELTAADLDVSDNDYELPTYDVPDEKPVKLSKVKKVILCHFCNEPFNRKYLLNNHIKTVHRQDKKNTVGAAVGRGTEKRFHCMECNYKTPYKKTLIYHIRTHTGEKPFLCEICNRGFAQPSSLISHRKTHSDRMYYTCPECGKQFKYKQKYERHKNVHVKEKKFSCTICSKALKSKVTLLIHMNRHYNIKNYSCETCGSTFVTSSELINHSKIHTNERNFCCTICEFRTYKKTGLEKHMKHHTGERPFKCENCELAYCTRGELKCHMRRHTKEKNYSCTVCHQKFIHSPSLNRHMLKLHGIKYKWSNVVDRRIVK